MPAAARSTRFSLTSVAFVMAAVENVWIAEHDVCNAEPSVAESAHTSCVVPEQGDEAPRDRSLKSPVAHVMVAEVRRRMPHPMSYVLPSVSACDT